MIECPYCGSKSTEKINNSYKFDEKANETSNHILQVRSCNDCEKCFTLRYFVSISKIEINNRI